MKFTSLLLASVISVAYGAQNFAPELPANSTCVAQNASTYTLCRSNALSATCSESDNFCNCRQSQNLAQCINSCVSDPSIYSNIGRQNQETEKWCALVPSSLLTAGSTPTLTPTGSSSTPTTTQPNILGAAGHLQPSQIAGLSVIFAGIFAGMY